MKSSTSPVSSQPQIDRSSKEQILLSSNSLGTPALPGAEGLTSIITYGGVAVAVIIAMAYFSQIQFKSLIALVKALSEKTK